MSRPLWTPKTDVQARLLGCGIAAAGGGALWWHIGGTLRHAEVQEEVRVSFALILLGVMFMTVGVLWIAGGLTTYGWIRDDSTNPGLRKLLQGAVIVVGLAATGGMLWLLHTLGYEF
jgi:hypothetical protein